jgi:hypothetical protein
MALPSKRSYPRPQALEVYIPQVQAITICMCVQGGAGTRDANQDRDGQGIDMSV